MREQYRREISAMGPDGEQLERLRTALAARPSRKRSVLRPALIAAVLAAALLIPVCAAAWRGWLEPVVRYGDNGALIEEYTVAIGETRQGERCDVTLENLVTDGRAVYCLFRAQFDEGFDLDAALDGAFWSIERPSWMTPGTVTGQSCDLVRVDGGSRSGEAEFIARLYMEQGHTMYYFDEDGVWNRENVDSLLGRVLTISLCLPDVEPRDPGQEERDEYYRFEDIRFNDTIDLVEFTWNDSEIMPDGTRAYRDSQLVISPLSVYLDVPDGPVVELLPERAPEVSFQAFSRMAEEAFARWEGTNWLEEFDVRLVLADGTHMRLAELAGPWETGGQMSAASRTREVTVWLQCGVLFPELRRPESFTALIINGARYELS